MLRVTDDSGFLAVVDPAAYHGFVAKMWDYDQLMEHFQAEMAARHLLIWGTGYEGHWRVECRQEHSSESGHRELLGGIEVSGTQLLVTNYESLTMVAQFEDEKLPQDRETKNLITLPGSGMYNCRIVQCYDPDVYGEEDSRDRDFLLEFAPAAEPAAAWEKVPWGFG